MIELEHKQYMKNKQMEAEQKQNTYKTWLYLKLASTDYNRFEEMI